ncbi:hypothetical protein FisN_9Lh045 [Fistulifera solaris]|uniref:G-protein coupled receptors family 1 profile domain-containing protein n=1 Tax=Fistulifera solaris TaxID=1519565 RepID=A0A1Z5KKD4_FISSO|nr:hypothetical protein FisN_9Lh045 [Fistulifera solaris]|eukprot:GAX26780.1 hypothetical protein FisN_9Lh045 [Fistulifera solaris]
MYDHLVAAGPDSDRMLQWSVWVMVASGVAIFVASVLMSMLCNKRIRKSGFNLYLVFLMIPDFLFSFLCSVNCGLNVSAGSYISEAWCWFQTFYVTFSIGANSWLNSIVAYHIYDLLQKSSQRQRYIPPSRRKVILNSLAVYGWSAFLASWVFWDILPHQPGLQNGLACLPVMYSDESMIFFFTAFLPALVGIPAVYVIYAAIQIWWLNLLPATGGTRNVSVFIARLILVFIVMWLPSLVLMFIARFWIEPWGAWAGGTWSHLQGAVSAVVCLMKPAIGNGYLLFMTCGRYPKPRANDSGSNDMSVIGWPAPRSARRISDRSRRLSHVCAVEQTEKMNAEVAYEIECNPGSSCSEKKLVHSTGSILCAVLSKMEEGEEKVVSAELELSLTSFIEDGRNLDDDA